MAWNSSKVRYNRLPSQSVAIDFGPAFKFDSVYTYGDKNDHKPPYLTEQREYKPSCLIILCTHIVTCLSVLFFILTFPVSACIYFKVIKQYERVVVFRLGRLQPMKGPGIILVLPWIDHWKKVDMRMRAFNVPPQQIFTMDGAVVSVGANIHFQISDGIGSVACIKDLNHSTRVLAQTALVKLLSGRRHNEIECDKYIINQTLQVGLNEVTQRWGVQVTRVEISDVTLLEEARPFAMGPILMPPMFDPKAQSAVNTVTSMISNFNWQPASPTTQSPSAPPDASAESLIQFSPAAEASTESATAAVAMSPDDILSAVKLLLNESLVERVGAVYKFVLHGTDSGTYYLDLKNGDGDAGKGDPPNGEADVVLELTSHDMQLIFSGELRPFQAYMSGRLVVDGDRGLAMKLEEVVKGLQASD